MSLKSAGLVTLLFFLALNAWAQEPKAPSAASSESPSAQSTPLPEPSTSARDLFSRYKDRLLQVRVLLNSANEQSALGSGFVVRDPAEKNNAGATWVLTNYHVISSLAIEPDKYRIELRGTNGRTAKAQLMALDVIHDLALLRVEADRGAAWPNVFSLRDAPLTQGSKIFSLGNPLELGFLISEGIYNGLVESRVYDEMLFSGALNSGMSGGPAIDEQGQVVGVNVATRRDGEQLSFLVPVRYARDLLARAVTAPTANDWRKTIAQQLLAHQDFLATKLFGAASKAASVPQPKLGFASQTLAGRNVPTLDGGLTKCWANGLDGEKQRYQRDSLDCSLRTSLFVRGSIQTGTMSLRHTVLRNEKLTTPQFLALESRKPGHPSYSRSGGDLTPAECHSNYLQPTAHVYRVSVCLRAYRKFENIYDFTVSATQIDDARQRQTSSFSLKGFSFDNGQRLTRLFLERLQ
jgi:serine protease Do